MYRKFVCFVLFLFASAAKQGATDEASRTRLFKARCGRFVPTLLGHPKRAQPSALEKGNPNPKA